MTEPYYSDESVTLYHGDAEELLPSLSADIIVTDPPYGVGVAYGVFDDSRPDYWEWMRRMVSLMRKAAPLVVFTHRVAALAELTGWDWIGVWAKPYAAGARVGNSCLLPHWEPVFLYGIHGMGTAANYAPDVFTLSPAKAGMGGKFIGREKWAKGTSTGKHPVPKPPAVPEAFISTIGQNAATVLDPFAGSGTTLLAAKVLGRRAIGVEIDERWCELVANRLAQEVMVL